MGDLRQSPEYQETFRRISPLTTCVIEDLGGGEMAYVVRLKFFPVVSMLVIQGIENPAALISAEELSRRYRSIFTKIAPKVVVGSEEAACWEQALRGHGYKWDQSAIVETKTIIVDLGLPEEDLLAHMKPKTRYNIRLAQRRGVTATVADGRKITAGDGLMDDFYQVYYENCRRIGIKSGSRKEMQTLFQTFGKNLYVVFAALSSGEPGAVATYMVSDDTVSYAMNGSTEQGRRDFATNLSVWQGMLEGKRRGCRWFDFGGVYDERFPKDEKWVGFSRFKAGFGGEEVTYLGSYVKWLPFLKRRSPIGSMRGIMENG